MEKTSRKDKCPLLGEPKKMFENDNVYVVSEKAEIGKVYSFVCPQCHTQFIAQAQSDDVHKIKCPDCETYICFSTMGKEGIPARMKTQVISTNKSSTPAGVLVWKANTRIYKYPLKPGSIIIGRIDDKEPSDISISDATASRQSVKIVVKKGELSGRHTFKLIVLRTTNAIYINNNALYSKGSIYLNYGDRIKVGETVFTLEAEK